MMDEKQKAAAEEEKQKIGTLMAEIIRISLESELSPFDAIFALGIATQAMMRFSIGPRNQPTEEQKEIAMKVFSRGFSQEIEMIGKKGGPAAIFCGVRKTPTH